VGHCGMVRWRRDNTYGDWRFTDSQTRMRPGHKWAWGFQSTNVGMAGG
jgi:hypothetical protein